MATWRVLTWNILGAHSPNLDVIAEVISGYLPDVVALQEVRRPQAAPWPDGWDGVSSGRASTTRSRHSCGGARGTCDRHTSRGQRVISASISPGVSTWMFKHRVAMAATVTRTDEILRIVNTHLASHDADERIASGPTCGRA